MSICDIHLMRNISNDELPKFMIHLQNFIDIETVNYYYSLPFIQYNNEFDYDKKKDILNYRLLSNNGNWFFDLEINGNYLVCHNNFRLNMMINDDEKDLMNTVLTFVQNCNKQFPNLFLINDKL